MMKNSVQDPELQPLMQSLQSGDIPSSVAAKKPSNTTTNDNGEHSEQDNTIIGGSSSTFNQDDDDDSCTNEDERGFAKGFRDSNKTMGALLFCGFNFLLYNIGSALLFSTWNGWSFVDSMYFASVTFTTCGYGDLFPEGDTQQLITCVYILFGVIVLGSIVLDIVADHIVDTYEGTANEVKELQNEQFIHNIETNNNKKNNVTSQIAGGEEEGDSDSEGSFNTARSTFSTTPGLILDESSLPSILYEFVDTLRTVIPLLLLIIGGAILIGYYEGWSIPTSIYYSIVTSTSVGYGDIVPETQRMKLFAIFYVPLSVALMAGIIGKITGVHLRRKALKDEYEFLNREMTKTDFELMDEDNDGEVTYEEFLTFMLVSMGKVDMEDMKRMKDLYEKLDTNGDGSIQLDDLMYCALGKES